MFFSRQRPTAAASSVFSLALLFAAHSAYAQEASPEPAPGTTQETLAATSPDTTGSVAEPTAQPVAESTPQEASQAQVAEQAVEPAPQEASSTIQVEALPVAAEAPAPEAKATRLEAVEVTGSRVKRAAAEGSQPVVSLTRKDLERTGAATIGDVLQTLSAAGSSLNTTINNGGTGATEVDLRNLGSNRVLVLVDGHRWVNGLRSLSTNSVDLNTIPLAIIDRVDVLQDGASAIYGSDAITGIVNIITRKKFNGINLSSQVGAYSQGDGRQQLHSITAGKSIDGLLFGQNTSFLVSGSFQDQAAVFAGDRNISRLPTINTALTRGSTFTPTTRSLFVANSSGSTINNFGAQRCASLSGAVADGVINSPTPIDLPRELGGGNLFTIPSPGVPIPGQASGLPAVNLCDFTLNNGATGNAAADYHRYVADNDAYNFAPANYLSTPLRTYNGYVSLAHEFNDNIKFSLQGLYSKRQSVQQLAPQPISLGDIGPIIGGLIPGSTQSFNQATFIPATNTFNPTRSNQGGSYPFGPQDIGRLDPRDPSNNPEVAAGLFNSGAVLRRMVEGDPRIQKQTVPTRFARGGFSGSFGLFALPSVDWELGYSYGISTQKQTLLNQYRTDRIRLAIVGNYVESGNNTRAQQFIPDDVPLCVAPCVPLNFFGGPGTITAEQLAYIQYTDISSTRSTQSDLYLNISTTAPLSFLPDSLGIAFGVERRTSKYTDNPSQEAIDGTTAGLTSLPSDGSVAAKEAYIELDIPLIKDFIVEDFGIDLAGRVSDYGSLGKSTNGKIGGKMHPFKDLLLRSSFSTSFRAPNTGELFLGNAGSFPGLEDPCAAPDPGSIAETNCTADGVPAYTQTVFQFYAPFTGNRNLKSETSHSLTAGFVFSPSALPGFDFSIDYFRIKLDNFIKPPGAQFILDQCYTTPGRSGCEFVTRNPNNQQLVSVLNAFQNFPSTDTSGIDFAANFLLPTKNIPLLSALGKLRVKADATFLSNYGETVLGSDGVTLTRTGYAGTLALPRWKINPSLIWTNGGFSSSVNTRIVWGTFETCDDGRAPSFTDLGLCSDPTYRDEDGNLSPRNRVKYAHKTDVQAGYLYKPAKASITLGVQNVFNQDPPIAYSQSNSFESSFWIPGRLGYVTLKKDF